MPTLQTSNLPSCRIKYSTNKFAPTDFCASSSSILLLSAKARKERKKKKEGKNPMTGLASCLLR
jgi:hypothetical protein